MARQPGSAEAVEDSSGFLEASAASDAEPAAARSKTVLNVGCGYKLKRRLHPHFHGPEWREIRLDINPAVKPDVLCSITDMSTIADGSIDAIWSSHNLEHLYRHEVPIALSEFVRVLRPAGRLLLTLPDLQRVAELVVNDELEADAYVSPSGPITPVDMIFGHTAALAQGDLHMAHRSGFTLSTLRKVLSGSGFVAIRIWRGRSFDLWATACKRAA